ncbi:MAG: undecaprenyl phosphate translocase family protein [Acidimicrobiales bacterium]
MRRSPLIQIVRGFCMGVADIIPGVSGGTVALLLGIYDRLITQVSTVSSSIGSLIRGDFERCKQQLRSVEWSFLASLLLGIVTALLLLASWLRTQIHERPVIVSSAFFGVIAVSAFVTRREIRKWTPLLYLTFGVAARHSLGIS